MAEERNVANWGNYPVITANVTELSTISEIKKFIANSGPIVARGNGRSYGDASLGKNIFSTLKLNHFLNFDADTGIISCQSGVLLSDVLSLFVPKGWFLPVTPGTKFITVGGAISADVHGKNQHVEGCFSQHLISFELLNGYGDITTCSRDDNSELFWNTVGGMGLTGLILSATFQLKSIESSYIYKESLKSSNLTETMELFDKSREWTYTVAWLDAMASGRHLGRSIIMRGEHATEDKLSGKKASDRFELHPGNKLNIPIFFPAFALNMLTIKLFNFLYYRKQLKKVSKSITHYDPFFYPLDSITNWNRIYGKKGFTQYQCVIPEKHAKEGIQQLIRYISKSKFRPFLTVLKQFGSNNPKAINSFPMPGYTLSLDFSIRKGMKEFIRELDNIVESFDGRVYLAKDAFSGKNVTQEIEALGKFTSLQHLRLNHNDE